MEVYADDILARRDFGDKFMREIVGREVNERDYFGGVCFRRD